MPDGPRAAADAGADRGAGVPRAVRARARAAGAAVLRVRVRVRRVCAVRAVRGVCAVRAARALLRLLPRRLVPGVTGDPVRPTMNLVPNVYNTDKCMYA